MGMDINFKFRQIGLIKTPYTDSAPRQPIDSDQGEFRIEVFPEYTEGLYGLEKFKYIYVVYFIDRVKKKTSMLITSHWVRDKKVGLFASRSPVRPNPIAISIVRIKEIIDNNIVISGIDAFNNTPLLDIKPYVKKVDCKADANSGWIDEFEGNRGQQPE